MKTAQFDPTYDAHLPTRFSKEELEEFVGKRMTLTITGMVTGVRDEENEDGTYAVWFTTDERYGFPDGFRFGIDADALVQEQPCDGAPCDCPTDTHVDLSGEVPGALPGSPLNRADT